MKYEDFIKKAEELYLSDDRFDSVTHNSKYDGDFEESYYTKSFWGRNNDQKIENPRLYVTYETGGYRGGNCWGGEAEPYKNDEVKELTILDELLKYVCPNLGFVQYRELCNKLIKEENFGESEYYGNSTDYITKYVDLKELYDYLVENEIFGTYL